MKAKVTGCDALVRVTAAVVAKRVLARHISATITRMKLKAAGWDWLANDNENKIMG